jgi:hypothetical protein
MVPGFNTDFKYRGQTFHVQTEDNGVANPVVVSLLYHKGAILASRRTSYRELLEKTDCTEQLKELMKSQHKALMRELLAGAYDAKLPGAAVSPAIGPPAAAGAAPPLPAAAPAPSAAGPAAAVPAASPPAAEAPSTGRAFPRRPEPALRAAPATPTASAAARRPAGSLDEAIMRYLEEHAAAAAAAR